MVGEVARNKALALVLGKAVVTDTNGAAVDLSDFVVTEEDEDEAEAEVVAEAEEVVEDAEAADAIIEAEEKPKKKAPAKKKAAGEEGRRRVVSTDHHREGRSRSRGRPFRVPRRRTDAAPHAVRRLERPHRRRLGRRRRPR